MVLDSGKCIYEPLYSIWLKIRNEMLEIIKNKRNKK